MERKGLEVKFHRQGLSGPIWGLFPDPDHIISQYPAETLEKAVEFFKSCDEELKEAGYKYLWLPDGTEIKL